VKSYVRNTINLSCAKILLTSVIGVYSESDMKHCVMKCSLLTLQQVVRVVTIVPVRVN